MNPDQPPKVNFPKYMLINNCHNLSKSPCCFMGPCIPSYGCHGHCMCWSWVLTEFFLAILDRIWLVSQGFSSLKVVGIPIPSWHQTWHHHFYAWMLCWCHVDSRQDESCMLGNFMKLQATWNRWTSNDMRTNVQRRCCFGLILVMDVGRKVTKAGWWFQIFLYIFHVHPYLGEDSYFWLVFWVETTN